MSTARPKAGGILLFSLGGGWGRAARASAAGLGPTASGAQKPRVVVPGTGWAGCRLMKGIDTRLYDVVCISTAPGSYLLLARCTGVDADGQAVHCQTVADGGVRDTSEPWRFRVSDDKLVMATGAEASTFGVHGVKEHAIFLRQGVGFREMSDDEAREEKELDLTSPDVVTKYKSAAEIVNKALQSVISKCKPKAKIVDLCEQGDAFIREQAGNIYKNVKKKIERGVAFPTCISVNNTVCHFSPLASDDTVVEENDIVKIDMGCHIDGFIAVVGHTHVIQEGPVTGRAADVIAAANTAAEVALRLVRPGKKNKDVTEAIQKVAAAYDCKIVEGVLSHQLKQFVIDGNKVIISVTNPETRVDEFEFEENEVYAIDVVTSTGEGKPKLLDEKQTTIYKRAVDKNYHLKMKSSRFIFSEISQKFPIMPFSARALEEKRARLGLVECMNHDLLQPYPVLHEKPGDLVAHIKFTVLLMPNGSDRITSHPLQQLLPSKTIDDNAEIKAWLALGTKTKKKGGGKKKKGKKGDAQDDAAESETKDGASNSTA
ncbi:Proliferation-associated protein 2G4 [Musa troglodytarum]|uniref:ERBB-3 BINDING PROTEIN 1 n=2 Tax=Musa troglodytarum TaxID=320322 RepID=A0A9E7G1M1_9LILI|nr:Proliferation-associated protein 2G4 [Musa troglodytarum]